jgi:hypothetical protein
MYAEQCRLDRPSLHSEAQRIGPQHPAGLPLVNRTAIAAFEAKRIGTLNTLEA